ncbi:SMC-Scp complex subunit ScpB [archaeon]|nr:SMC-Scp complex subunit ScpB [archaeon]
MSRREPKLLAEAALFMSTEPLSVNQIARVIDSTEFGECVDIMDELYKEFNLRDTSMEIVRLDDGRYRMQVRKEFLPKVKKFAASIDLPKGVVRTLSIVAFKQPITQSAVAKIRGNKSYEHIEQLAAEGFIKKVKKGHTYLLETTRKFDAYFQLPTDSDLNSLDFYNPE